MCTRIKEVDREVGARPARPGDRLESCDRCSSRSLWLLRRLVIALGISSVFSPAIAQTRYVVDAFKLEARSGPSTGHKIVKILESGAAVEVLGEQDGYSRIQLDDGTTAFMLTRYLTDEPSARSRLDQALADLAAEQTKNESLSAELIGQQSTAETSATELGRLSQERDALATELDELKQTASSAVEIRQENQNLQQQVSELQDELQSTQTKNRALSDTARQSWFIAGGGVLFAGILMGLIIPKIRWQRRRGWNEL